MKLRIVIAAAIRAAVLASGLATAAAAAADSVPQFTPLTSPGGIAFHHRYDGTTPFAAINFGWRDEYAAVTPGKEGLAAVSGALILQGAMLKGAGLEGRAWAGPNELIERLKDLGASTTFSSASWRFTGSVRAPADKLAEAVMIVAAALRQADPSDRILARIKQRATGADAQAAIQSETIANRAILQLTLGDHPVVRSFDLARFERVGRPDLDQWRRATLDRQHLRIAVSGRLGAEDAGAMVDQAFADLPASATARLHRWPTVDVVPRTVAVEHETRQSVIVLAGPVNLLDGPDEQRAAVANAILGGSGGRIWQAVRGRLGASYGGNASLQKIDPRQWFLFIRATVANDQVAESLRAMRAAYGVWYETGLTAAELVSSTARQINAYTGSFTDPATANGLALATLLNERPIQELSGTDGLLRGQTVAGINGFIKERFPRPDRLLAVVVTPTAAALAADCIAKSRTQVASCRR